MKKVSGWNHRRNRHGRPAVCNAAWKIIPGLTSKHWRRARRSAGKTYEEAVGRPLGDEHPMPASMADMVISTPPPTWRKLLRWWTLSSAR